LIDRVADSLQSNQPQSVVSQQSSPGKGVGDEQQPPVKLPGPRGPDGLLAAGAVWSFGWIALLFSPELGSLLTSTFTASSTTRASVCAAAVMLDASARTTVVRRTKHLAM
jgi:hypothetical protein